VTAPFIAVGLLCDGGERLEADHVELGIVGVGDSTTASAMASDWIRW
jgi:hypothetical protein